MAIGPEARRLASGRIVVVGGMLSAFGVAAIVLGAGPILETSQAHERAIGVVAIGLGLLMLAGGTMLGIRRGPARAAGIAGCLAAAALGTLIGVAAVTSLGACGAADDRAVSCGLLIGGAAVGGMVLAGGGVASALVVSRARPEAFRRRRRPPRVR